MRSAAQRVRTSTFQQHSGSSIEAYIFALVNVNGIYSGINHEQRSVVSPPTIGSALYTFISDRPSFQIVT